ncbi:hypothetical protein NDU88_005401, partial [Pleurodeles waltl]
MNRMVKACVQEAIVTRAPLSNILRDLWWAHRNTPNSVTNIAPFEHLRGRVGRTKLFPARFNNTLVQAKKDPSRFDKAPSLRERYQRNYKLRFDIKHGVAKVGWKAGDLVLVKDPGFKIKGRSLFKGPFRIREVKKNIVILDNGDVWSMSRITKWTDAPKLEDQRKNHVTEDQRKNHVT